MPPLPPGAGGRVQRRPGRRFLWARPGSGAPPFCPLELTDTPDREGGQEMQSSVLPERREEKSLVSALLT